MTTITELQGKASSEAGVWWSRLHRALMPDYNRQTVAYWWITVLIGGGGSRPCPARVVGAVAARPGRSRRGHCDRRAGRLLPVPGSALEEFLYRRRGRHLPPAAAAGAGRRHAGGRRRGTGRLMAHLQALDEPDHQPRHGEHRHARRRRGVASHDGLFPVARAAEGRRAVAGDDGLGAGLLPDQHGADHGRALSQARQVAHSGGDVRQLRLGRHQRRRQRAGRLPAVPRLPAGGNGRADRRRADGGDARDHAPLRLPPAAGQRGHAQESPRGDRARGPARRSPCARARGERAALPQRLHPRLDRHGAGVSGGPRAAGERGAAKPARPGQLRVDLAASHQRIRRRRRHRPANAGSRSSTPSRSSRSRSSCSCATAKATSSGRRCTAASSRTSRAPRRA